MSLPTLPNWVTTWIAIGAFVIAVAGFVLRWIEFRQSRQRRVTIELSGHFVEENEVGAGFPVCNLEVLNSGLVTVRVRWWYLSNGIKEYFPGPKSPLVGVAIEPGNFAGDSIDYNYLSYEFGDYEFRAKVMLVGERRPRRSNWFGLSSQALPATQARRVWRVLTTVTRQARRRFRRRR